MYKYNAISTMVYRAIKICSSYIALHKEFKKIKTLAKKNGYPISMVNSIIKRQLNLIYDPPVRQPTPTVATNTIVLKIPCFAQASEIYSKQIVSAAKKHYLQKIKFPMKFKQVLFIKPPVLNATIITLEKHFDISKHAYTNISTLKRIIYVYKNKKKD